MPAALGATSLAWFQHAAVRLGAAWLPAAIFRMPHKHASSRTWWTMPHRSGALTKAGHSGSDSSRLPVPFFGIESLAKLLSSGSVRATFPWRFRQCLVGTDPGPGTCSAGGTHVYHDCEAETCGHRCSHIEHKKKSQQLLCNPESLSMPLRPPTECLHGQRLWPLSHQI